MECFSAIFVICGLLWVYFRLLQKHSHWKQHSIPSPKPTPFLGHFDIKNKIAQYVQMDGFYQQFKGQSKFIGLYFFTNPVALVTDLDMVKDVLIKDFDYFVDRGVYYNEKDDPLSAHLFNLESTKWRPLRAKLTPTFTSGKMKMMFPTVVDISNQFQQAVDRIVQEQPRGFEIRDVIQRYTTDVIGSCAFGIDCNSFLYPENEFRRAGKLSFDRPFLLRLKINFCAVFPKIARSLKIKRLNQEATKFYTKVVKETVEYRVKNKVNRNDFMNLLIDLKNSPKSPEHQLTLAEVTAQSFIFLAAGFETSSTTMVFCLFELAQNQDIQDKVRASIFEVLKRNNNELTYESLNEMDYLENVVNETLRKYPPVTVLHRFATKDYKVPDTEIVFKKGMLIMVPVYSIHHDPNYYPEPERFDPSRFDSSKKHSTHPCSFLPFGAGPRNCIGLRFGMMEAKIGLIVMLTKFRFLPTEQTPAELEIDINQFLLAAKGGVILKAEKLTS